MSRPLKFRYYEGTRLREPLIREVWRLRVDMLKLARTPEEDWTYFSRFLKREDTALLAFHDPDGVVQGFFTISYLPVEHDQHRGVLFFSKYFYFREAYRGHYKTILAPWVLLPKAFQKYGVRSLHFVTSTFPQSFVSLSRSSGNVRSLKGPGISPWQRAALTEFAQTFYGEDFDETSGLIRNQNVVDTATLPQSQAVKQLASEYERLNPEWRDGTSLPIIFSVNSTLVAHVGRRTLRRLLPRRAA